MKDPTDSAAPIDADELRAATYVQEHGLAMPRSDVMLSFPNGAARDAISFKVADGALEVLRLDGNGDIFVRGRLAENDRAIVEALRIFLRESGHLR